MSHFANIANLAGGKPALDPDDAVMPMDTAAVASELQKTWNRPDAQDWAEVYTMIFPPYRLLIESHAKAQEVATTHELLDSQRS